MSRHDECKTIMESLHYGTSVQVAKCLKNPTHSGRVQAQRELNKLVELKLLERRDKFYCIPGCKASGDHALAVSDAITEIYFRFENPQIYRETLVKPKSIRPDILCLAAQGQRALCFIVEVILSEVTTPNYTKMKRNVWNEWAEASEYLSNLFKVKVKHFDFVTSQELTRYLEEVCAG